MEKTLYNAILKDIYPLEGIERQIDQLKQQNHDLVTKVLELKKDPDDMLKMTNILNICIQELENSSGSINKDERAKIKEHIEELQNFVQRLSPILIKAYEQDYDTIHSLLDEAYQDISTQTYLEKFPRYNKERTNISGYLRQIGFLLKYIDGDLDACKISDVIQGLEDAVSQKILQKEHEMENQLEEIKLLSQKISLFQHKLETHLGNNKAKRTFDNGVYATEQHNRYDGYRFDSNLSELQIGEFGFETSRSMDGRDVRSHPGGTAEIGAFRINKDKIVFLKYNGKNKGRERYFYGEEEAHENRKFYGKFQYLIKDIPLSDSISSQEARGIFE